VKEMIAAVLAITVLLTGTTLWFKFRYEGAAAARDAALASLESERAANARLRVELDAERSAALERAAREAESARDREALVSELKDCDLDEGWRVPDALYDRLCRGAAK
jgi:hypothetical protein